MKINLKSFAQLRTGLKLQTKLRVGEFFYDYSEVPHPYIDCSPENTLEGYCAFRVYDRICWDAPLGHGYYQQECLPIDPPHGH